jgi:hypothetical protein
MLYLSIHLKNLSGTISGSGKSGIYCMFKPVIYFIMRYLLFLLLLPAGVFGQNRKVRNILNIGRNNYFQNIDFNEQFRLVPGDTVVLSGTYGDVDFKRINGIVFVNEGQVIMKSITVYPGGGARDIQVLGDQTPGIKYGIKCISPNGRFAMNFQAVGNLVFRGISTDGNQVGFKIVYAKDVKFPLNHVKLTIENCEVKNCKLEGMYIGADHMQKDGPFITGLIRNCVVKNAGWDAIQCRAGQFQILDNVCDSIGLEGVRQQDHGILIGGNTKSSVIRGNKITNVTGYAIFNNGFGEQVIECNEGQSGADGIVLQNHSAPYDYQRVGYQKFVIRNNVISQGGQYPVRAYCDKNFPTQIVYTNNRVNGPSYFDARVKLTNSGNSKTRVINCIGPKK